MMRKAGHTWFAHKLRIAMERPLESSARCHSVLVCLAVRASKLDFRLAMSSACIVEDQGGETRGFVSWMLKVGSARTVYSHCIWPYVWWFPCQKYRLYTVYIWFWPALAIGCCLLVSATKKRCMFWACIKRQQEPEFEGWALWVQLFPHMHTKHYDSRQKHERSQRHTHIIMLLMFRQPISPHIHPQHKDSRHTLTCTYTHTQTYTQIWRSAVMFKLSCSALKASAWSAKIVDTHSHTQTYTHIHTHTHTWRWAVMFKPSRSALTDSSMVSKPWLCLLRRATSNAAASCALQGFVCIDKLLRHRRTQHLSSNAFLWMPHVLWRCLWNDERLCVTKVVLPWRRSATVLPWLCTVIPLRRSATVLPWMCTVLVWRRSATVLTWRWTVLVWRRSATS